MKYGGFLEIFMIFLSTHPLIFCAMWVKGKNLDRGDPGLCNGVHARQQRGYHIPAGTIPPISRDSRN